MPRGRARAPRPAGAGATVLEPEGARAIRIAILASTLVVGGAEMVVAALAHGIRRRGHIVRIDCLHEAGPVGRRLEEEGLPLREDLAGGRLGRLRILRRRSILGDEPPDVLLCLDHKNAIVAAGALGPPGSRPVRIVASHATGLYGRRRNFGILLRGLLARFDRIVALTPSHRDYLVHSEGLPADRLEIIPNGIPLGRFAPLAQADRAAVRGELGIPVRSPVVIVVAALRPEKAHEVLLRAARRVGESIPESVFLLVGGGTEAARLEALAGELGVGERVRFLGVRRHVARLLGASDLQVLCSSPIVETLPLSVMEGMACGLPVVATRVGSVGDLVTDGESGLLVEPDDSEALGGAIIRALGDPDWRLRAGEAGRRRAREVFDEERMIDRYLELFDGLLGADRRKGEGGR